MEGMLQNQHVKHRADLQLASNKATGLSQFNFGGYKLK